MSRRCVAHDDKTAEELLGAEQLQVCGALESGVPFPKGQGSCRVEPRHQTRLQKQAAEVRAAEADDVSLRLSLQPVHDGFKAADAHVSSVPLKAKRAARSDDFLHFDDRAGECPVGIVIVALGRAAPVIEIALLDIVR